MLHRIAKASFDRYRRTRRSLLPAMETSREKMRAIHAFRRIVLRKGIECYLLVVPLESRSPSIKSPVNPEEPAPVIPEDPVRPDEPVSPEPDVAPDCGLALGLFVLATPARPDREWYRVGLGHPTQNGIHAIKAMQSALETHCNENNFGTSNP